MLPIEARSLSKRQDLESVPAAAALEFTGFTLSFYSRFYDWLLSGFLFRSTANEIWKSNFTLVLSCSSVHVISSMLPHMNLFYPPNLRTIYLRVRIISDPDPLFQRAKQRTSCHQEPFQTCRPFHIGLA